MRRTEEPAERWIEEDTRGIHRAHYRILRTLLSENSDYQRIEIVEADFFGRMLFLDDSAMLSERDEFVYHEMIAHVPLFGHPHPRRVLVIGGGDGGTVREVLRHREVEHCRMVEIDRAVVDACRDHLQVTASALDDPRLKLTYEDGTRFVAETRDRYDVVLVDSTDPVGPAEPLFGPEFYGNVRRVLSDDGVVVSQAESPFYYPEQQRSLVDVLRGAFPSVALYNYSNLVYPGGIWSFSWAAADDRSPVPVEIEQRVRDSGLSFRYYSPEVHRAAFALPAFQRAQLEGLPERP